MQKRRTCKPLPPVKATKESTGVDRLYKRTGRREVSFYYQHPDGKSETLAKAPTGDRAAIAIAERTAKRKAIDIIEGQILSGSVADLINRFADDEAPQHFVDQSKDGMAARAMTYRNLIKFFGKMQPSAIKTVHAYQYLDARAKAGAPILANKEIAMLQTIFKYAIRWGIVESSPLIGLMLNKREKDVRTISRSQVVRFYLWSIKQSPGICNLGCAAMFAYLTGFRAAEVRPFLLSGLTKDGVRVISAKRKKGEAEVSKLREWSPKLRVVVARAKQAHAVSRIYLFGNLLGAAYSRSGWGSVWHDAMFAWIASFDKDVAMELAKKLAWDASYKAAYDKKNGKSPVPLDTEFKLVNHHAYFALSDVRPAAITTKLRNREKDAYDFAAHANPSTTHKHYDRRKERRAKATE